MESAGVMLLLFGMLAFIILGAFHTSKQILRQSRTRQEALATEETIRPERLLRISALLTEWLSEKSTEGET